MITKSELYANMSHESVTKESHKSNPRFETAQFITSCPPRHAQLKKKSFPKFVSAKIPNLTHTIRKLISYFSIE